LEDMKKLLLILTVTLAGCAGSVLNSTPRSTIIHAPSASKAMALAEGECGKHGRHARLVGQVQRFEFTFDCVE